MDQTRERDAGWDPAVKGDDHEHPPAPNPGEVARLAEQLEPSALNAVIPDPAEDLDMDEDCLRLPGTITSAWVERLQMKADRYGWFKFRHQAYDQAREDRFTDPEEKYWSYTDKPLWITLSCSLLAVGLFVAQWWWPELRAAQGWKLPVSDGWIRFGMMVLGGYLAFLAWPHYRPKDWTASENEARLEANVEFHKKIKRH